MIYGKIKHSSHPHHDLVLTREETPYTCNMCFEIGLHSRYECNDPLSSCNFHLHKECGHAVDKPTITHLLYPGCAFAFFASPIISVRGRYCDVCRQDIKGYNYHCYKKGYDLHPCCAKLPMVRDEGDVMLELKPELREKCYKCGKKGNGCSYVSTCREYHLHVACVKEIMIESWEKRRFGSKAMASTGENPTHDIVFDKGKKRVGKFERFMKIAKIVLASVVGALVGDPTALVTGLISALYN